MTVLAITTIVIIMMVIIIILIACLQLKNKTKQCRKRLDSNQDNVYNISAQVQERERNRAVNDVEIYDEPMNGYNDDPPTYEEVMTGGCGGKSAIIPRSKSIVIG